jgi:metal-responsive CopG/Arc/MetJ family transcriptional regulator
MEAVSSRRSKLTVSLDDDILSEVDAVVDVKRGSRSGVIRGVLAEWARARQSERVAA